ncbi:hypothetical protein [Novosphingobium rosa]|uniref:hypothetical protein n=1 Tax=Novosphingobium rosa TaxID=76978 RepID=UPI00082A5698|nr:hypothetical protein [Novosphingobium rosa]
MASNPIAAALDNPTAASPQVENGAAQERDKGKRPAFPDGCPVTPLGVDNNISGQQKCYYLDWNGQLNGLEANNRHGKLGLIAMFGPTSNWLEENFPQWSAPVYEGRGKERTLVKPSEIVGFDQAEAARALIEECARKGVFDPAGRMRGRGAHNLGDGIGLALHCGKQVLVSSLKADGTIKDWVWLDPGEIDGNVYVAGAAVPMPWHTSVGTKPAEDLLKHIRTWNFVRPVLDPRFLLGAIGASLIGGALPWRPNIWITGGRGTGKSSLNGKKGLLHRLMGDGCVRSGNASAAGIRQKMQNATLPVMFDELESDNRYARDVIELARVSSSGDDLTRGGGDHKAHEFTLASLFWFSSILVPPMEPADLSRLALLQVRKLRPGGDMLDLDSMNLPRLGRMMMRRMIDGWHRLRPTKRKFHLALAACGHDSRACDQFGTLLACADLLINDWQTKDGLPDDEEVAHWAQLCHPEGLMEVNEETADEQACINLLTTTMVQSRGGDEREALSSWMREALHRDEKVAGLAQKKLGQIGLRIVNARLNKSEDGKPPRWGSVQYLPTLPAYLAVANTHQALNGYFKESKWAKGVWKQTLGRFDGAHVGVTCKMAGAAQRCVLVPLYHILDETELEDMSKPGAMAKWIAEETERAEA